MHPYFSKEIARDRRRERLAQSANRRRYYEPRATARRDYNRRGR